MIKTKSGFKLALLSLFCLFMQNFSAAAAVSGPDNSVNGTFAITWTNKSSSNCSHTYTYHVDVFKNGVFDRDNSYYARQANYYQLEDGVYRFDVYYSECSGATNSTLLFAGSKTVTVSAANEAPTVEIVSPTNNITFSSYKDIVGTATANDPDGTIVQVEFHLDGGGWVVDTTAPYSVNYGPVEPGFHNLIVRALDNDGNYSRTDSLQFKTVEPPGGSNFGKIFVPISVGDIMTLIPLEVDVTILPQSSDNTGKAGGSKRLSITALGALYVQVSLDGVNWVDAEYVNGQFYFDIDSVQPGEQTIQIRAYDENGVNYVESQWQIVGKSIVFIHTDALGSAVAESDLNGDVK